MITVFISRMGNDEIEMEVPEGTTVGEVLAQSGISVSGREQMYVDGVPAKRSSILEDEDVVSIVTPKQNA